MRLPGLKVQEKVNSFQERACADYHHNFDSIEIPGAGKATSKVGSWIGGGVELSTYGTNEPCEPLTKLGWNIEVKFDDIVNGNVISQVP